MRVVNLYQLYDKRARTPVGPILAAITPTGIIREIIDQIQEGKSHIAKHPQDFVIYQVGVQDLDTCVIQGTQNEDMENDVEVVAEVTAIKAGMTAD